MPYGFHKAIAYVSLTATCGLMGAIAGPAGIAVGLASGAALAKVSMKRNPREKAKRRQEIAEQAAKRARIRERKKREHKERGESISRKVCCGEGNSDGRGVGSEEQRKEREVDDLYQTMKEWNGLRNSDRLTKN